jgi:hypothetical protein
MLFAIRNQACAKLCIPDLHTVVSSLDISGVYRLYSSSAASLQHWFSRVQNVFDNYFFLEA